MKNNNLKFDHKNKTIYVNERLNPPSYNARFLYELKSNYSDYLIVKNYEK